MHELGKLFALMVVGSGMIFFLKGVWEVRTTSEEFRFINFFMNNVNRLVLLAVGLVFTSVGLWLDPAGMSELFEQLPQSIQVASPLVMGAALAGLALVLPQNYPPQTGNKAVDAAAERKAEREEKE